MKIKINVEEIEFEGVMGRGAKEGRTIEFSFHDQIRIKKAFERELARLFFDTKNDNNGDFSIWSMLKNEIIFTSKNSGSINFIKEIDGGEFSLSAKDRNPSQVGKRLAKSIYSSLNLMDNGGGGMRSSYKTTTSSTETTNR